MSIDDQADIFKRWEKEIYAEWHKKNAFCSYVKENPEEVFKNFVLNKLVSLFTIAEMNSKKILELLKDDNYGR